MRNNPALYDPMSERDACGIGLVADINSAASRSIITDALGILERLEHRGAVGGDSETGDGAGLLVRIPHGFFERSLDFELPPAGTYGAGFFFLPAEPMKLKGARSLIEKVLSAEGGLLLGWRDVPVRPECLGDLARKSMPSFCQLFISFPGSFGEDLERRLYVVRRTMENSAVREGFDPDEFYICSFSARTMVYKGMFVSKQFVPFYCDLSDPDFTSNVAIVHQRYSTNTFPSWRLAQPFRLIAHNGEINTLYRNMNNMKARESSLDSGIFGSDLNKLFPIVNDNASDSANFDLVLELLSRGGRSLPHALMMMIPEAFGTRYHISEDKRAFFEYHAAVMEPWDGPAALVFTDGDIAGAMLDRNGLRPARYLVTRKGRFVLSSEAGVLKFPPEDILEKGRLGPGAIIAVDFNRRRVLKDHEIKSAVSRQKPYRHWLEQNRILLKGLFSLPRDVPVEAGRLPLIQKSFGYTREDIRRIIIPMAESGREPVGSMGNDTPPAGLSDRPQLLFNYFRQLFAQVTNPPIDPYRENLVMSLMSFVGREKNLLAEGPEHCRQLKLLHPILTNDDIDILKNAGHSDLAVDTVGILFDVPTGESGAVETAMTRICREVEAKVDEGCSLIILSDRGTDPEHAAVPSLLAVSGVHHYLVRKGKRHLAGIIVETGEAREVHHYATLIGYGASGVNPYLVFETIKDLNDRGDMKGDLTDQQAVDNYITAVKNGLLKIMSKMGISTLRSYRGAQLFEAIGLHPELTDRYFTGTKSRIGGIGLDMIEKEKLAFHRGAFMEEAGTGRGPIDSGGLYSFRVGAASHLFSPEAIILLQRSTREADYSLFKRYSKVINDQASRRCTLRSLLTIKKGIAVPLDEVEPEEDIVRRFVTSAMSFGSISPEAHTALAEAMNSLGSRSNSGEGGEAESRFTADPDGKDVNSRIKQVASGRFGVTSYYLVHAEELQIKMAQGAKPGEGGQLPGVKVNDEIAAVRRSTPGVTLISPPPHHDIYSIEDLAQLIYDLKHGNPEARVSVKLVSQAGVGTVAAGVAKARADTIVISGGDGGTGAAPLSSIMYTGAPWELGLAEIQQVLLRGGLRDRIRIHVDGQVKTGRDIVIAALLGAEEFGFATTCLVTLGCVMARKCHQNTCPVGVATQDPALRKRFRGKSEYVVNFMHFLAREVREYMAEAGFRTFDEMIGRVDRLETDPVAGGEKTASLDLSPLIAVVDGETEGGLGSGRGQEPYPPCLDDYILDIAEPAVEKAEPVVMEVPVSNTDRSVGASLSAAVSRLWGGGGLPPDTLTVRFSGSAGQSFGAFLAAGLTFHVEGEVNDFTGKGLSGGKIIIRPPEGSVFIPEQNIIAGNVTLFGATGGEMYICGRAGERFAVRNSGALAVVEGVGDHACEYMTGGRVIVLGDTGINFAAGMSGGIAYVLDRNQLFDTRCNLEMVDVEPVSGEDDREFLRSCIERHGRLTRSPLAERILALWEEMLPMFVRVIPFEYRRVLENEGRKKPVTTAAGGY